MTQPASHRKSPHARPASRLAGRNLLLCALLALTLLASQATAQRRQGPEDRRDWRRRAQNRLPVTRTIDSGYVFFQGRYVPPPYHLEITKDAVTINGRALPWAIPAEESRRGDDPTRDHRFIRSHPLRYGIWIYRHLDEGGALLVEADRYGIIGHPQNLELMLAISRGAHPNQILTVKDLDDHPMRNRWQSLLAGLKLTDELIQRLEAEHDAWQAEQRKSRQAAQRRLQRRQTLDAIGQAIAPVGLASAIGAIGLLLIVKLQSRKISAPADGWDHLDPTGRRARMVFRMVLALWVLNALDLSFTLLSHEAGHLNELNPLGRMLLHDSTALMLFKGGFVALGTTVLLLLRRYRGAEVASWWLCLVYALLTLRWTTYSQIHFG